MTSVFKMKF